jgi:hypothetical protein
MNTFNRFIITALLVFFTSQVFAVIPAVIKVERTGVSTLTITHDQPVKKLVSNATYSLNSINGRIFDAICENILLNAESADTI